MRLTVGILHPGSMGAYLGAALATSHNVLWTATDRSADTVHRATAIGLRGIVDLRALVRQCHVIISVCPPHAAVEVAQEVARTRSHGFTYVDANSIAPQTVRHIADLFRENVVVDAALTGGPGDTNTRIWLSGNDTLGIHSLFEGTPIGCRIVGHNVGQASALKMCAGLRSKVIPAVWATLIEAASAYGPEVEHSLREHLRELGYDLDAEATKLAGRSHKAWRWTGEMQESAKAMAEVGMPPGFSEAAASTYLRIAGGAELT